jgi:hypothetical protein
LTESQAPEAVVTEFADVAVATVGYRTHDGEPATRVDIIDRRRLVEILSLTPDDAVRLADCLRQTVSSDGQDGEVTAVRRDRDHGEL